MMLGTTTSLRAVNRGHLVAVVAAAAIAAVMGLLALAPTSAHASGCTDTWTNTAGGNWFTGSNWSKEAPPGPEDEACITANGTYTVTMTQNSSTVTVRALTVGGTSGTQTLVVGSSCSLNAVLTSTNGLSNGAQGAITMTNGDGCGESVTLTGPLTNAGTLTIEPAHGGTRTLQGNVTNTGTFAINANTAYNGASGLWTNKGALDLAAGIELTGSNKTALTNSTGGSIVAAGAGGVLMGSGTTFTEGAGTTSGTKPVVVDDGALVYTGGGKSLIAVHGSSTLSGNLAGAQSLSVESTCSENNLTTAASSLTNAGTVTLTNGDGCGDNATLAISAGTLTNSGKIVTEVAHGGKRQLEGNITNTGTLAVKANTEYNSTGTTLTNEGALNVAEEIQFTIFKEDVVVNGPAGNIATTANADLFVNSGGSFTEGAGTTSGTKPVIVDDGALTYTGGGKSSIALHGTSTLSGDIGSEQTLSVESTCSEHASTTAAASFTNAGTIKLTNGDGCGNNATLTSSAGTLTNSGKIITEIVHGGKRVLQGNITNTGTLSLKANTEYNGLDAALINEGALNVAEETQFTVSNGGSVTNGTGGSITATGSANVFLSPGSTFNEGAGTTTGTKPVVVDDSALNYTGAGASAIALHGVSKLSGDLGAEQTFSIESTCSEHATTTAAASFTNAGTIKLTNGDGCGNNATLTLTEGTLTNSGKIVTEAPVGGSRTLQGNLANTGSLVIKQSTTYNNGGLLTNTGTINISEGTQLVVNGASSVTNGSGGNIIALGNAALAQTGGTFTQASGKTSGTVPVILDDGALKYAATLAEPGSGPVALRGTSTLSGRLRAGNALLLQSTCGEHAVIDAGSFESFGTIELTNGDGCGNNVTLNLGGGTLTSGGTINVANPHGGQRVIQGNLVNKFIVAVAAGEKLQVNGNYTQTSGGRFKTFITSASELGSMTVSGTATLEGILAIHPNSGFHATAGQTFAILSASALSGAFATESGEPQIKPGLYYKPTYSATGVTLVATQVTFSLSATSGLPGSAVTVNGSGYLAGDTVTLTFTDHKGVKTTFPGVITNGSGEYSAEIEIPASAAAGAGTLKATSTQSGVRIIETFKVT